VGHRPGHGGGPAPGNQGAPGGSGGSGSGGSRGSGGGSRAFNTAMADALRRAGLDKGLDRK
jgi:uncharacterized protein